MAKFSAKRMLGGDVPGILKNTLKNDELSNKQKLGTFLDPHSRMIKRDMTPGEISDWDIENKEKQKKKRLKKSRAMGATYSKGGKTTMNHNCRGMGCATHGGKFRKDG
jgi:hypothetical protein